MNKLIALRAGFQDMTFSNHHRDFSSHVKQQALLFDQISVLHLEHNIDEYKHITKLVKMSESSIAELEWLKEKG